MDHPEKYEMMIPPTITTRTSTIDIPATLYLWIPVPGSPNIFLYLHNGVVIYVKLKEFYL